MLTSGSGKRANHIWESESKGITMAKKSAKSSAKAGKIDPGMKAVLAREPGLAATLQQIEKSFGGGAIMPLGAESQLKISGIPTGSLSLDMALGGFGLPRGRIIEVYGPESSGKTTLALHVAAEAQKAGGIAAIIDAEHAFDPGWGKKLGVELDSLLVSQPSSGEEAMQITEMLVKSNSVDVIIIDSVAALVPRAELEGEIGASHVGLQARLMSQSMRKLTGAIAKSKSVVIFINQIREKIGVMFGSPETTPGGRALKFYASCRIDVRRIGALKDGEEQVGQRVKCKIVKNKVAPPFRIAEFDMMHNNGISFEGDILDLGLEHNVLTRSGAWFKYGETYLGQGKEKARNFLIENTETRDEIRDRIMTAGGFAGPVEIGAEDAAADADALSDVDEEATTNS
ncbi:Protein RecA [Rosistilla ulvae]|uniref:Protein RecA n=2 Tax=Rosistilla ulvae TaxID=1930277 RepID=A0A517LTB0_9BACT|nr:Protein RecA [Rosistilla ulvae]